MDYNREHAVTYAKKWANGRNPLFYNFTGIGGDCTNFVSQCIYAGSCKMNFTPTFGWYYTSPNSRAPAWSGVPYLYNFIVNNAGAGPFAVETDGDLFKATVTFPLCAAPAPVQEPQPGPEGPAPEALPAAEA